MTRRLCLLGRQALREALHLRLTWSVGLAGLALVAGASVLRELNFGMEEARFLEDFSTGTVLLFGTVQAVLLTVTIIHGGLERGEAALLFTRGVRRSEWLVACLLAVWVCLAGLVIAGLVLLGLLLAGHGHGVSVAGLGATGAWQMLRLGLVAVFALATSTVSRSPVLAVTLALALTVAAQLAPVVAWAGSHGRPAARLGWVVLGRLLPDLAALGPGAGSGRALVSAGAYAVLYTLAACLIFSRREI